MTIFYTLLNILQLLCIAIVTVFCSITGMLGALINHKFLLWIGRSVWSPLLLKILGARLTVSGRENIDPNTPYIFTANHSSFLDIPVLFIATKRPLYFVAKKELLKMPFIGQAIWLGRMIYIDRSNREKAMKSMKKAGEMILNGKNVITFPEGTRSIDGSIKTFRRGSFIIAQEGNIPIVPVAIKNASTVWPGQSYRFRPGKVELIFGKPILPSKTSAQTPEELAELVRHKVISLMN